MSIYGTNMFSNYNAHIDYLFQHSHTTHMSICCKHPHTGAPLLLSGAKMVATVLYNGTKMATGEMLIFSLNSQLD